MAQRIDRHPPRIVLVNLEAAPRTVKHIVSALNDDVLFQCLEGLRRRRRAHQRAAEHFGRLAVAHVVEPLRQLEHGGAVGALYADLIDDVV